MGDPPAFFDHACLQSFLWAVSSHPVERIAALSLLLQRTASLALLRDCTSTFHKHHGRKPARYHKGVFSTPTFANSCGYIRIGGPWFRIYCVFGNDGLFRHRTPSSTSYDAALLVVGCVDSAGRGSVAFGAEC